MIQLTAPGKVQSHVGSNDNRLAAVILHNLTRALLALIAEDDFSSYWAPVRIYTKCGDLDIRHAIPLTTIVVVLLSIWPAALWAA